MKKYKHKSPGEIIKEFNSTKNLDVLRMELIRYGYSIKTIACVLKLIIQGRDIEEFLKKQSKLKPMQ